ncbi:MAG: BMC domain-containing protein [Solirubrobacterales bacterium]
MPIIEDKARIIQEFVPGKQVTLAHIMANADPQLFPKIGLMDKHRGSVAVMTLTPGESAIIGGDIAAKASDVELAYVDRFSGSLLLVGQLADVEAAVRAVVDTLVDVLGFTPCPITRT